MKHVTRRIFAFFLAGMLLLGQVATAAYACSRTNASLAPGVWIIDDAGGVSNVSLCAQHCKPESQRANDEVSAAPEPVFVPVFSVPLEFRRLEAPLSTARPDETGNPPALTILHCCLRI